METVHGLLLTAWAYLSVAWDLVLAHPVYAFAYLWLLAAWIIADLGSFFPSWVDRAYALLWPIYPVLFLIGLIVDVGRAILGQIEYWQSERHNK